MKFYLSFLGVIFFYSAFLFAQTNCEFARSEYLVKNPDVKNAGMDPWTHFTIYGKNEGRIWPSCNSSRDPRRKDIANVFWNGTYPLYSLTSDIQISPNNSGEYFFWGTTNEDPSPKEYKLIKGQVNTVYKFIDQQECVNFCNEVRKSKGMQLLEIKSTDQNSKDDKTLSELQFYNLVYEGESDNPYSSFEDYLTSKKKEKESEYLPQNLDQLRTYANSITDPFEKIEFLNKIITKVWNKLVSDEKVEITSDDMSIFYWSYIYKLETILPNQYDSPYISIGEWESLFNFLSQTSFHESMYKESNSYRAYYLYWFICVRQKLDKQDGELFKMVVNEFTRDNFDPSPNFYDQCKSIVNNSGGVKIQNVTRKCTYKFVVPTLTITWIDNRRKCCNPYCKEKSISYSAKEENLKDAEIQYLKDALEAHCLEINASQEHRNLDFNALTEFINQHYYQNLNLPSLGTDVNKFLTIMNDVSSWGSLVSSSLLKKETNQEKISRLRSKSKKLNIYRVTKYCSNACEQICIDNEYRCD